MHGYIFKIEKHNLRLDKGAYNMVMTTHYKHDDGVITWR